MSFPFPRWALIVLGLTAGCQWSCTKQQGTQVIRVTVDTIVCVLDHENDPPLQIAAECGVADVQDVIAILDAHRAAEVRERADGGKP